MYRRKRKKNELKTRMHLFYYTNMLLIFQDHWRNVLMYFWIFFLTLEVLDDLLGLMILRVFSNQNENMIISYTLNCIPNITSSTLSLWSWKKSINFLLKGKQGSNQRKNALTNQNLPLEFNLIFRLLLFYLFFSGKYYN